MRPREYFLYVSRLEPENNAHVVIQAFEKVQTTQAAACRRRRAIRAKVHRAAQGHADPRIRFTGAIYGSGYRELQSHAYVYMQATEVGGTHPALIEAMGAGNCVIAKSTPENREVLADTGLFFDDVESLRRQFEVAFTDQPLVEMFRAAAQSRARARYSWDAVTDAYENLFRDLAVSG